MATPSASGTISGAVQVLLTGIILASVVMAALVLIPVSVRHSAPFGTVQTVDFSRSIAVLGGEVRPNYPQFNRVDLDFRAYGDDAPGGRVDLVLRIQTIEEPRIVRQVSFSVDADRIAATRSAFAPNWTTVAFEPIADSSGQAYYVSIERGARNADDIVTLWGIRSYSTLPASDVVLAAVEGYRLGFAPGTDRAVILVVAFLVVIAGSVTVAAVTSAAWQSQVDATDGQGPASLSG